MELLRLWRETGATVMLITHALDEAALLSDRVAVMSARPGRLIDIVTTGWPRERDSTAGRRSGPSARSPAVFGRCCVTSRRGAGGLIDPRARFSSLRLSGEPSLRSKRSAAPGSSIALP